jgi:hypothetical protein
MHALQIQNTNGDIRSHRNRWMGKMTFIMDRSTLGVCVVVVTIIVQVDGWMDV